MKKLFVTFALTVSVISCSGPSKPTHKEVNLQGVHAGLRDDSVFARFIGYHIVTRDGSESFFAYRNQRIESSTWLLPNLNVANERELFFKENPNASLQLDIMKKYGIKAVLTYNYNEKAKRLEYSDSLGYGFSKYELTFLLSDSISLSCINFDFRDYMQLVGSRYNHIERLDSNWLVLK